MTIGIDKLNFFTPNMYVDLVKLAHKRSVDPDKFTIGIGQDEMAVPPITQDSYSMALNAAYPLIDETLQKEIDLVIFASESAADCSKSGAVILHHLLGIQPFARSIEFKQACYSATAGILMARDYIEAHPGSKALVVASDIARYGLATSGEVTQGAGACAMIIAENPRILELHKESVAFSEDIFDFWRPNYSDTAFVDGKFSNQAYIKSFEHTWHEYARRTGKKLSDFAAICFHMPYTKMGKKALLSILEETDDATKERLLDRYQESTQYNRRVGNLYTGSLYLSLLSLLHHSHSLHAGDELGLFSYGSGAVGEFFTATLVEGFEHHLDRQGTENLFNQRVELDVETYEKIFTHPAHPDLPESDYQCEDDNAPFYLAGIIDHKRIYKKH